MEHHSTSRLRHVSKLEALLHGKGHHFVFMWTRLRRGLGSRSERSRYYAEALSCFLLFVTLVPRSPSSVMSLFGGPWLRIHTWAAERGSSQYRKGAHQPFNTVNATVAGSFPSQQL